jgi:hypothetical protein
MGLRSDWSLPGGKPLLVVLIAFTLGIVALELMQIL